MSTTTKPPSAELRFAEYIMSTANYAIGGRTDNGQVDTSVYRWTDDAKGKRWQLLNHYELRAIAQEWLRNFSKCNVSGRMPDSCVKVLIDLMLMENRVLDPSNKRRSLNIVPLRNAYLLVGADGRIEAVEPDMSYGVTYAIQTDLDWSRVENGIYCPAEPNQLGRWGRYLATTFVDDEVQKFTQEALSSILLSRCYEKGIWLYGEGENGKSVMLHILNSIYPDATAAIKLARLTKNEFGTAALAGKKLVVVSEMPPALTREMQTVLKSLFSWDPMPCEYKNRDAFTMTPQAVWVMATNHHPDMSEHEHGFHRKVEVIPFTNRVPPEAKVYDLHKLITEDPAEMSQVIDWLLAGAQRLTQHGWRREEDKPQAVKALRAQQRRMTDSVAGWLEEVELEYSQRDLTRKDFIYEHYSQHVLEQGKKPLAAPKFWMRIREHFRAHPIDEQETQKTVPTLTGSKRVRCVPLRSSFIKPEPRCVFGVAA